MTKQKEGAEKEQKYKQSACLEIHDEGETGENRYDSCCALQKEEEGLIH